MTLMSLGPIVFDLITNIDAIEVEGVSAFAKHEIVNGGPVYEGMGEDETAITIEGVIHPEHFGGVGSLAAIEAARLAQIPLPLMRGNFVPMGWVIIERFSQSEAYLNEHGVGREVRFSVALLSASTPGAGFASQLLNLFR